MKTRTMLLAVATVLAVTSVQANPILKGLNLDPDRSICSAFTPECTNEKMVLAQIYVLSNLNIRWSGCNVLTQTHPVEKMSDSEMWRRLNTPIDITKFDQPNPNYEATASIANALLATLPAENAYIGYRASGSTLQFLVIDDAKMQVVQMRSIGISKNEICQTIEGILH